MLFVFYSIHAVTKIFTLRDHILDAHWLSDTNDGSHAQITIATAHNTVWCIDYLSGDKISVAQCEENSILYPLVSKPN